MLVSNVPQQRHVVLPSLAPLTNFGWFFVGHGRLLVLLLYSNTEGHACQGVLCTDAFDLINN